MQCEGPGSIWHHSFHSLVPLRDRDSAKQFQKSDHDRVNVWAVPCRFPTCNKPYIRQWTARQGSSLVARSNAAHAHSSEQSGNCWVLDEWQLWNCKVLYKWISVPVSEVLCSRPVPGLWAHSTDSVSTELTVKSDSLNSGEMLRVHYSFVLFVHLVKKFSHFFYCVHMWSSLESFSDREI
jgi:hypothetical protein